MTAQAALEEVFERASALKLAAHASRALNNIGGILGDELGQLAAAAPYLDRALDHALANDLLAHAQRAYGFRACHRFARGDWSGALADVDAALALPGRSGPNMVDILTVRGRIQAARGDPDALETLEEAARWAENIDDLQTSLPLAIARSEYFTWHGDAERAREEAHRHLDRAMAARQPFKTGALAYQWWRVGGVGDQDADAVAVPYQMMMRGDWAAAAAEWERRGDVYARAQALAIGTQDAATEALRILDQPGAARAAEYLRAALRKRGFTRVPRGPRKSTAANPAGLSPRQVDVLVLLTEGLSNAEIAARLSLSAKTVEHHITAVLGKLGVTNRTQAAAAAYKMKLIPGSQMER